MPTYCDRATDFGQSQWFADDAISQCRSVHSKDFKALGGRGGQMPHIEMSIEHAALVVQFVCAEVRKRGPVAAVPFLDASRVI